MRYLRWLIWITGTLRIRWIYFLQEYMANQNSAYPRCQSSLWHKKITRLIIITINNLILIWDKIILSIWLKHKKTTSNNKITAVKMITVHYSSLTQKFKCFLLQEILTLQEPKETIARSLLILKQCHSKITFHQLKFPQLLRQQIQDPILKKILQRSLQKVWSVPLRPGQLFSLNPVYKM